MPFLQGLTPPQEPARNGERMGSMDFPRKIVIPSARETQANIVCLKEAGGSGWLRSGDRRSRAGRGLVRKLSGKSEVVK